MAFGVWVSADLFQFGCLELDQPAFFAAGAKHLAVLGKKLLFLPGGVKLRDISSRQIPFHQFSATGGALRVSHGNHLPSKI